MSAKLMRLWRAQKGKCFYCNGETYLPNNGQTKTDLKERFGISSHIGSKAILRRRQASIEHLVKRADGGTLCNSNIVMACFGCNVRRNDDTVEIFKEKVTSLVAEGRHWTLHPYATGRIIPMLTAATSNGSGK